MKHISIASCSGLPAQVRLLARILLTVILSALCTLDSYAQENSGLQVLELDPSIGAELSQTQLSALEVEFISNHPVLRVAIAGVEYPPFQEINNNVISGHSIQFLQSIARASGFKLEYLIYDTWKEVQDALKNRQADLTPMSDITVEKNAYLVFTAGVTPNPAGLAGRKIDDSFKKNQKLINKRVAVGIGSAAQASLNSQFPESIQVPVHTTKEAFSLLNSGGVDFYYGPLADIFFEHNEVLIDEMEIKQRVFFSSGWNHIAVRSDWPIIKNLFDRFVRNGRMEMDPLMRDVLGDRLSTTLPPLNTTPDEASFLSSFSSLRVGTYAGIPLLNDMDASGRHIGIASEFTAYIAYQLGLPIELKNYTTNEDMLKDLDAGLIDVIPYFAITEERKKELVFTDPYLYMPWLALGNSSDTLFWDLGSLYGRKVALRKLHPLLPTVQERYPSLELVYTDSAQESVDLLVSGKVDATVETKLYVNRTISEQYLGELRVLGEVKDDPGAFAFAVDPRNSMLVPIFNKSLASMDPVLEDRILRRWVAVDFEPAKRYLRYLKILVPFLVLLGLFLLAAMYWNRIIVRENKRRAEAEQRLVDMTDRLQTGVYQFRQYKGGPLQLEFSNRTARELSALPSADSDSAGDLFEHIDPADKPDVMRKLSHSLSTGEHFCETFRYNFPDGEKGWILSEAYCREEPDGARIWSGYLFDLTSERQLNEELNAMILSRDDFISMASHELRTPVQNVYFALESINPDSVDATVSEKLQIATSAAKDLDELVTDIVHLTGMNSHSAVLSHEIIDFHQLIDTVCRSFVAQCSKKGLDFKHSINSDVPIMVYGDELRIKQVLYNIIGNAIKYTDAGAVVVDSYALESQFSKETTTVRISVTDTGIGISQDQQSHIFEPFSTVGPMSRRSSGLGLALCDRLVAVMGGEIEVSSKLGEGSMFTVDLPLNVVKHFDETTDSKSQQLQERWNVGSKTILVVDDNFLVRETLSTLLNSYGWEVIQAESGQIALNKLEELDCIAVVSDQQMPGMNGLELAHKVRLMFTNKNTRPALIMMSGGMEREHASQANEVFDAMLFKPVAAKAILQTIDEIVNGVKESRASIA